MISTLADALAERGYDTLTPVQQAVIDPDLTEQDLLVSAQTGSGKTVGFGLAIAPTVLEGAERFGPAAAPLGLVIAPSRELATQVMRELAWLYARTGAVVASCVGGMDMRQERRALDRGAHLVVGTPGRLRDHIERGGLDLGALRAVVLDEADEMLDMGFREDLEFMLETAPAGRRTLLFSATVPPVIARLAQQYQRDARRISTISSAGQHADIAYQAVRVAASDVDNAVFNLLRFHDDQSALVFANTRATVSHLTARLANRGLSVVSLSGELSQSERTHALQAMRDGRARVCVATDVAARGIDLPRLNLVIHADLPGNTESLLHRSGRTGRAGRKGISALIVPPKGVRRTEQLLKWAKIDAEWTVAPSVDDILRRDEERLLADPSWDEPLTDEQQAFAQRLLARHSPEAVAGAYLRLHQTRHAAPEDLLPPDTRSAPREKPAFGPSRWVALSVGRAQRAEARWLLPMMCRAGGLDRNAIGAIRVQDEETYVEIAQAGVDGFLAALGGDGVLEDGIKARLLDAPPELSARPARAARDETRERRAPRAESRAPRTEAGAALRPTPAAAGTTAESSRAADTSDRTDSPQAPPVVQTDAAAYQPAQPAPDAPAGKTPAPGSAPKPASAKTPAPKGRPTRDDDARPATARKSADSSRDAAPGGAKPGARSGGAKFGGAKFGGARPGGTGGEGARPARTAGSRPGKPRPDSAPAAAPASDARDTSKRFTPPGKEAPRDAARDAPRPGGKPKGRSTGGYDGKPGGKPGAKPAARSGGKPFGKPAGKSWDRPGDGTGGKPAGRPQAARGKPGQPGRGPAKPPRTGGPAGGPSGRPRTGRPDGSQPPRRGKP
ncbi:MAG: DEAD/DEAH box helicase [Pararhodobacter sp.]|nr:DEAD/DEAH box helicase [Pararhodobacter sp.]